MRKSTFSLGVAAVLLSRVLLAAGATPDELLKASDRARGGSFKGLSWSIDITTDEDGDHSDREFFVKANAKDALVEATAPARTKGEVFLFNDREMWFYKSGLKKPVAISSRQKLTGQAANGDIASTNYARDYNGTIVGKEKLDGKSVFVLELKAKDKNVTYDQIRYWVSEKDRLGIKAEFKTLQGEPIKVATFEYGNQISSQGKSIPFVSKMTIVDAKFPQNKSVIVYHEPKIEDHPASIFNINNLAR